MNSPTEQTPPKLALKFLRWFCRPRLLEDVEGDLLELFHSHAQQHPTQARIRFILDVLLLFRPDIIRSFRLTRALTTHTIMIKNHFFVAYRMAIRHKGYTLLNLLGLAVGMAVAIVIFLWVDDEMQMNRFHAGSDRIYQVWRNMHQSDGDIHTTPGIPQPLELVLGEEYPEVEKVTLVSWPMELTFQYEDQLFYESGNYVSPDFFGVFSFPFLIGDPSTALQDISSIAISEQLAAKYFGRNWEEKALGKTIRMGNQADFVVTGVFKDTDSHSTLQFDWVVNAREYMNHNSWVESWYNGGFGIFVKLTEQADIAQVRDKVREEVNEHTDNAANEQIYLQPFNETYLYSNFENGLPSGGRIQYVHIFLIIAFFILLISCINYTNLSTARSSLRAKEIGIRKVIGAQKGGLRGQFFSESFFLSAIAILISILLVAVSLPFFNDIAGKELSLDLSAPKVLIGLVLVVMVTGFFAGIYPALLMPSFHIIRSLKGLLKHTPGEILFRKGLVTVQFALSILLIIGTLIVYKQLSFILNKDLGLDRENVVYIEMEEELIQNREVYRQELAQLPGVATVSFSSGNPLDYGLSTGGAEWDGKDPNENIEIYVMTIDENFIPSMRIELSAGRNFSRDFATDTANYLINEVAARIMGFENPIDQNLTVWGQEGKIVGLIKNFHMDSMFDPIEPMIIRYDPAGTHMAFIRTQGNLKQALEGIEAVTLTHSPSFPFQYEFLDESFEEIYENEKTLSQLAKIFAVISILISCLGLLGLASFSASQRSKEIGIRKVLGAKVSQLVLMLSKDYARLIVLAFVIAMPIAYLIMKGWLSNFSFRTDLNIGIFLLAGLLVFMMGTLVVSLRSYQASVISPVKTLKDE